MNSTCCLYNEPILFQVLPPILIMEFAFGMAGNGMGLWMFFHLKTWKPNSVYLLNLSLADFLVLFCLLFRTEYYLRRKDWIYGDFPCRILLFMLASNRAAGIIFLTVVAVDRYLRIVHPFHKLNRVSVKGAILISCILWLIITAMTVYLLAEPHLFPYQNSTQCESFNICPASFSTAIWHDAYYISQFLVPVSIIGYCTICITCQLTGNTIDKDGRVRKAIRFIVIIAVVFTVCYFPSNITRICIAMLKLQRKDDCDHFRQLSLAFYTSVCFTYFYSMLNPVVYYFSNSTFKGLLKSLCHKRTRSRSRFNFVTNTQN